mgnify:CR=1 FL=1
MPKGKKSKRCGIGKISDGKGGCRKMTAKEKRYVKESVISHATAGASMGDSYAGSGKRKGKKRVKSAVMGAVAGGIAGYRSGKKSIKSKSRHATTKMKGYPKGNTRAFSYKKKKKK